MDKVYQADEFEDKIVYVSNGTKLALFKVKVNLEGMYCPLVLEYQ